MSRPGQYLFDDMCKQYSFMTNDAVEWDLVKSGEIVVTMKDGSKVRYSGKTGRYTNLTQNVVDREADDDFITEAECRREFARRLHNCMRDRAINQTTLSELTGISQVIISKYVNGKVLPGYYNISKLARALRCSTDDLIVSE